MGAASSRLAVAREHYERLPIWYSPRQEPEDYDLSSSIDQPQNSRLFRRRSRTVKIAIISAIIFILIFARFTVYQWTGVPTYDAYWAYERHLPQHNSNLPAPEGREGRYVRFGTQVTGKGWNNMLEDLLLNGQTALLANRSLVFPSYIWSANPLSPVLFDGFSPRSAVIPLNAFVSGPIAGSPISDPSDRADKWKASPRFISDEWWETVCPKSKRVYLDIQTTQKELGLGQLPSGKDTFDKWAKKLGDMQENCVEVTGGHIWSFGDGGSSRLISAWYSLSASPILNRFSWSPLVKSIVHANLPLLIAGNPLVSIPDSTPSVPNVIRGLLAVHIRRGDFATHCNYLRKEGLDYAVWNTFPTLLDQFEPGSSSDRDSREMVEMYNQHCFPTANQVMNRIHEVKRYWEATGNPDRHLNRVYIMSNAEPEFLEAVRNGLAKAGWDSVMTTYDLTIPRGAEEVVVAADMLIGERAELFLGNGFSTLTSNVNLLRKTRSSAPESCRLW